MKAKFNGIQQIKNGNLLAASTLFNSPNKPVKKGSTQADKRSSF